MVLIDRVLKLFSKKEKLSEIEKQIKLLKKNDISNYIIENDRIIITGNISLNVSEIDDKDLFKNITINGILDLGWLLSCDKDFLSGTIINGHLFLHALREIDKDFLQNTTINGNLDLSSIKYCHKDFLKNKVIIGCIDLYLIDSFDKLFLVETVTSNIYISPINQSYKDFLKSNIKKLSEGFNKDFNVLYLDGKISRVYSFYEKDNYVVYKTNNGTIHQRNTITDNGEIISKFY